MAKIVSMCIFGRTQMKTELQPPSDILPIWVTTSFGTENVAEFVYAKEISLNHQKLAAKMVVLKK